MGPESFIASYSQSFLDLVIFDNPNHKFSSDNISPAFTPWIAGHDEVQYNVTSDGQTSVLQVVQTDPDLLQRCE